METRVIAIETPGAFKEAVNAAEAILRAGGVVAVPTETVYGLAANAFDERAVLEIYRVKGRPEHNPIIVHVANLEMARSCVAAWPREAGALAENFWPGPLTMVLPKSGAIAGVVTAGGDTVGIRWPAHPFMQALIQACQFPIAAPSANPANQLSPTQAEHVVDSLQGKIPLIVDAGPAHVGIESTVVQLVPEGWRVLRPGLVSEEQIETALGKSPLEAEKTAIHRSPGLLPRHYAPKALLRVIRWSDDADLERQAGAFGRAIERVHVLCHHCVPKGGAFGRVAVIPEDPEAYARALYAELHRSDREGAELVLVEEVPPGAAWEAIRDRLRRASAEA